MADPLSLTASVLAVVTASVVSIKSLKNTVERYRGRDVTLERLLGHLDDLVGILETPEQFAQVEASMLALLKGPVERCKQLCQAFEKAMEDFAGKSKTGFRDWAKLEFMKGNINEFMDTLSNYKSTISLGVGTITLQRSKATHDILEQYSEVVQQTTYNLNLQLQRINEKIENCSSEELRAAETSFEDEKTMLKHCIRICEQVMSCIESMADREQRLYTNTLSDQGSADAIKNRPEPFRVHKETRELLQGNRDNIAKFLGRLQERLHVLESNENPDTIRKRTQLKDDINALEASLEVCKIASVEVSRQKEHTFGEVVAEGNSDQVVVTTWADLFNVTKAISKDTSAQLIGSMTGKELLQLSKDRYNSRFGASNLEQANVAPLPAQDKSPPPHGQDDTEQPTVPRAKSSKATPNEMRKRTTDHHRYS